MGREKWGELGKEVGKGKGKGEAGGEGQGPAGAHVRAQYHSYPPTTIARRREPLGM